MCDRSNASCKGFTLIELLVVVGVIAVLASVVIVGLGGADQSVSLRSAQATVANALNAARTRAVTRNVDVALLVHNDPSNPDRYRRVIALAENVTTSSPVVVAVFELPKNTGVIPHLSRFNASLRETGNWNGGYSNSTMASSLLGSTISLTVSSTQSEAWEYRNITPLGTTTAGALIVATVRHQASGTYPILFVSPDLVRGFRVSAYSLSRMVNDRFGF